MREDLERKEKQTTRSRNEEQEARARLKEELEALRTRAQQEQQQKQQAANAAAAANAATSAVASTSGRTAAGDNSDDDTTQLLMRTVKVTWDPTISNYSTDCLRQIFSNGWSVEDIILKDTHKRKKVSVLVVLNSTAAAQQAAQEVHGHIDNPLLITPYLKVIPGDVQQGQQQGQQLLLATWCGRGSA
eukprot:GHRR01021135.1.p1 GENE.GHRR01021135.1~~GHRR01021135.1.p1  ORF type:complete len:188 (+),score=78.81 GHRR01021135.1:732-1295(+)